MKRIFAIIITGGFVLMPGQAQNEADALRYSQNFYGGTARSISMAGAFGALGGDFSSASLNPAGIGVYRSTEITFTPTLQFDNTSSKYLGKTTRDNQYQFLVNNFGFVHSRLSGKDEGWIGVTFGVGYNQLNSFNRNTMISGIQLSGGSESSSLLDNFTNNANAYPEIWSDFYEELAWQTYLINYDTLVPEYWNHLRDWGYGQSQKRRIQESGGIGELVFTLGANYNNKLYFGASFGIQKMSYTSSIDHTEIDDADLIPEFSSFTFNETLETRGTGYTLKAGMIYRPISLIRIGAAIHLPTFYRISEDFYTDMYSRWDDASEYSDASPINQFDYRLRTPYKVIGSVAVQLGKLAIFSADYEFMDYRNASFDSKTTDYNLLDQNDRIQEVLKATSNIRAGAEVHLGQIYLRAGTSVYGSPYSSISENGKNSDAWTATVNGGLGFRSEKVFFDIAFARKVHESQIWLYIPEDTRGATINNLNQQLAATIGIRF